MSIEQSQAPLIMGGQGRSAESLRADAWIVVVCLGLLAVLVLAAAIVQAIGGRL